MASLVRKMFTYKEKSLPSGTFTSFGTWSPGPPTYATVPPGICQFNESWQKVPLKQKLQISPDTFVFTFATPDEKLPLNLSTCACLRARLFDENEKEVIRPYTPCSTNAMIGEFQLMIKIYPDGQMTQMLCSLKAGDEVEFAHRESNVKIQYPFDGKKEVCILVGGAGITPMLQALHAILGNKEDKRKVKMIYGSRSKFNILGKDTLDHWSIVAKDQLEVIHVLSEEPEDSRWKGARGFITKELIEAVFPPPGDEVLILVCGPPPLYNILCGSRDKPEVVTGILGHIGYSPTQVYKF